MSVILSGAKDLPPTFDTAVPLPTMEPFFGLLMKNERTFFVYILTNKNHTVLYVGVTNDLFRRMEEHRSKAGPGSFTTRYNLTKLVYYDCTDSAGSAIEMEKRIKGWTRVKKIALITGRNPKWEDLSGEIGLEPYSLQ